MRFHFHATKILELRFMTVLAAFQDESSHDVRFPEEDAGCLRQLPAIWPTDLHAASSDTSNATDLCLCPAYARMAGTRSPGHGVTGELVRENLPPRCRELVACSQTRSWDKLVHELARIGGGGYQQNERDVSSLKKVTLSEGPAGWTTDFQTRKARLRSGIRGRL